MSDLQEKIKKVKLLALDSDGVLTDGGVYILEDGTQFRRFDIKDGLGLVKIMKKGIKVAVISASDTESVLHRGKQLGFHEIHLNIKDKLTCLNGICKRNNITLDEVAYMGDDLTDLPVLEKVGFSCAPADALEEVINSVMYVTKAPGGYGAVRDVCDMLSDRK